LFVGLVDEPKLEAAGRNFGRDNSTQTFSGSARNVVPATFAPLLVDQKWKSDVGLREGRRRNFFV
jgi:hypothetical protein